MVFKQDKYTDKLGTISEMVLKQTIFYMKKYPVTLFIPATYEDATEPEVVNHIISVVKGLQDEHMCLDEVILGLDGTAPALDSDGKALPGQKSHDEKVKEVYDLFSVIPRFTLIPNDSPGMRELYDIFLKDKELPIREGKGRNLWTALGYRYESNKRQNVFVMHDCDIRPEYYSKENLLSLIAPVIHPFLNHDFSKAYYTRISNSIGQDGGVITSLGGRVTRLLMFPWYDALIKNYRQNETNNDYLNFLKSFDYTLSGDVAMKPTVVNFLPVQADWGIEIGTLNFLSQTSFSIAQVYWDLFGHKQYEDEAYIERIKHANMSLDIIKKIFRMMYTNIGPKAMDKDLFEQMRIHYRRFARETYVPTYEKISFINGWYYDTAKEHARITMFEEALVKGFDEFRKNPDGIKPLPHWDEIGGEEPKRLLKVVREYNEGMARA